MPQLLISVQYADIAEYDVAVADTCTVAQLVAVLSTHLGWRLSGYAALAGQPWLTNLSAMTAREVAYTVQAAPPGRSLFPTETLAEAGVVSGAHLRIRKRS